MCLSTLGIPERTAISKVNELRVMEREKEEKDKKRKSALKNKNVIK